MVSSSLCMSFWDPILSVNLSSVPNFNHDDDELAVLNLVDYPVISLADSVIFFA